MGLFEQCIYRFAGPNHWSPVPALPVIFPQKLGGTNVGGHFLNINQGPMNLAVEAQLMPSRHNLPRDLWIPFSDLTDQIEADLRSAQHLENRIQRTQRELTVQISSPQRILQVIVTPGYSHPC